MIIYQTYKFHVGLSRERRFSRFNCCFIYKNKVFTPFFVIFEGKMAAILDFSKKNQILKKQLLNIWLRDIVAKYELPKSKSEVIGAKIRFFLKNTKKW